MTARSSLATLDAEMTRKAAGICGLLMLVFAGWLMVSPGQVATYETSKIDELPNGCLVAAVEFQAERGLRHRNVWARIVQVSYLFQRQKHAYCVYALRNGDIWAYSIGEGSFPLGTRSRSIIDVKAGLRRHDPLIEWARYID